MKFAQVMECNVRNIFLERPCANWVLETTPRPLSKESKWILSLDKHSEICFCCMCGPQTTKIIEIKELTTCIYLI